MANARPLVNAPGTPASSKMTVKYVDMRPQDNASCAKASHPGNSMTYKLYNAPQSTCSQRVRFVLNTKGLPFDEVKLNLLAGDQLKPDYLKLNPNGVVPTLDHDGQIVINSNVITEYLDEVEPQRSFTPEDPVKRAHMRTLMHFIDEMPAAAVRVPTFNLAFLPSFQKMSATSSWRWRNRSRSAANS